jgi:CO dehydrogenase nickel-insertion accessory protein CooC1
MSEIDKNDNKINLLVIVHNKDQKEEQINAMERYKENNKDFNYLVKIVNNVKDYELNIHGLNVEELYMPYISNVSQGIYELLRTRVRR